MDLGHGGQILVSASTAALVAGVDLMDLGEHRLRGLSGVERLCQVRADGLTVDFPRLQTMETASETSQTGRICWDAIARSVR